MSWTLYVDESGDFSKRGETGVVAGVVVPGRPPRVDHDPLRRDIQRALPGTAWPPHSAELTRPVSRLLAAAHRPSRDRSRDVDAVLQRVAPMLEGVPHRSHDQVRDLDVRLRQQDPGAHKLARKLQAEQDANLDRVMRGLGAAGAFAVIASAPVDPSFGSRPPGARVERDAYVRLLRLVMERVLALLWHADRGVDVVHAVIATRSLHLRNYSGVVPLQRLYQDEIIAEAATTPLLPPHDPHDASVRIVPTAGRVRYLVDDCPGGLFVADWLAYHARHALMRSGWTWSQVRAQLQQRPGIPVLRCPALWGSAAPLLPTVVAGGPARQDLHELVQRRRSAKPGATPSAPDPAWVSGASAPWLQAAGRGWRS